MDMRKYWKIHKDYDFYQSDEFKELFAELEEAYDDMDIDTGIDIMLDMKQAEKDFESNLPWWYKARWDNSKSREIQIEARKIYTKNIYKWA